LTIETADSEAKEHKKHPATDQYLAVSGGLDDVKRASQRIFIGDNPNFFISQLQEIVSTLSLIHLI
jgi:hypothetical protein